MKRWSLPVAALVLGGLLGAFFTGTWLQGQVPAPPPVPKELASYREVVKRVLPAVVSIEARTKSGNKRRGEEGAPDESRRFFDEYRQQPPGDGNLGFGSGFIVDPRGVVLTNYHVIEGADSVDVTLQDGRKFTSRDFKFDTKTDLAIVRLDAKGDLPFLELGDSDEMEVGDRVLAVGAPFGLIGSVTSGIVSAKGRSLHMNIFEDFVQTDAAINPGNSGGPLVNLEGKVIGVNSAIKSRSGGFQGVGLAISSRLVRSIMDQLLKDGTVRRGYLGVQVKDLTDPELAKRLGVGNEGGVVVTQVHESSPAAKSGLQEGDVITHLAGKPVRGGKEMQMTVTMLPPGKPVTVTVVRDAQARVLEVMIEEPPGDPGSRGAASPVPPSAKGTINLGHAGVEVADLTPELAESLGYSPKLTGAVVVSVDKDGPAARAGLKRGLLITKVDKQVIRSAATLRDALDAAALDKGVLLQVRFPTGDVSFVLLKKN